MATSPHVERDSRYLIGQLCVTLLAPLWHRLFVSRLALPISGLISAQQEALILRHALPTTWWAFARSMAVVTALLPTRPSECTVYLSRQIHAQGPDSCMALRRSLEMMTKILLLMMMIRRVTRADDADDNDDQVAST